MLVKEPVTQNPFKLVYSVIKYAIQNKYMQNRSAFTYCEDEIPSRIDFGKIKYGGPFTTEQVEDVKTYFRLMVIIAIASVTFAELFGSFTLFVKLSNMFSIPENPHQCYSKQAFIEIFIYIWPILLPFYEFLVYPFLHCTCISVIVSRSQVITCSGLVLLMLAVVSLMSIELLARHNSLSGNVTIQCVSFGALKNSIDYRWLAVPSALYSVSLALCIVGAIRFVSAQSPYSMRGLILGSAYGVVFLSAAVGVGISVPFTQNLSVWGTGIISCGFWHALLLLTFEGVAGIVLAVVFKRYKSRKREDVLPNEHIFAERYYDRDDSSIS